MLKPVSYKTDQHRAYQQALDDFGITELLAKLKNYSDADFESIWMQLQQPEIETLAAILISALTHSINGKLLGAYVHLIRHNHQDIALDLINLKYPNASIELPTNFPDVAKTPRFLYGDRLRWLSHESDTDWGIVIGRFYSFASDRCCWSWCYLIWLSKESQSAAWSSADIAWEEDLEPMGEES
ncbi:hypothetical protein H6G76_14200 [Nostoc sp. FACHB-152]|uniref:hypothetical protein n=1 Tax=unclassified Nostoc TaxID=2593658 RepID=UPI00168222D9|nr:MULTISPECIES: hypothetical protein [unclassified Nostoc]MBD2448295.1 hypothetical protein [Nostoc sp. FACHB-152]MBD2467457.1 hypothetical protein [Nostoc sp. FACHB-145]